jgi:hypothetical protein
VTNEQPQPLQVTPVDEGNPFKQMVLPAALTCNLFNNETLAGLTLRCGTGTVTAYVGPDDLGKWIAMMQTTLSRMRTGSGLVLPVQKQIYFPTNGQQQ